MLNKLDSINDPKARERIERAIIKTIISTKERFGLGVKPVNFRKETFNNCLFVDWFLNGTSAQKGY
jgi:hypothetical protein